MSLTLMNYTVSVRLLPDLVVRPIEESTAEKLSVNAPPTPEQPTSSSLQCGSVFTALTSSEHSN